MNNIPDIIRTGIIDTPNEDIDRVVLLKIEATLMKFMENAVVLGAQYAKAAGRDTLTSKDIEYALKYNVHEFVQDDEFEKECDKYVKSKMSWADTEDSSEEEYDSEEEEEEEEEFTRADNSSDPIIIKMNKYVDEWSDYQPTDRLQQIIKQSIDSKF